MKTFKVLKDPEITYQKVMWHCHVEIGGQRFVIAANEDNNGSEHNIYHYDANCRYGVGEPYTGDDYDKIHEELWKLNLFSQGDLKAGDENELKYDENE